MSFKKILNLDIERLFGKTSTIIQWGKTFFTLFFAKNYSSSFDLFSQKSVL
jgi:hypothetical protein